MKTFRWLLFLLHALFLFTLAIGAGPACGGPDTSCDANFAVGDRALLVDGENMTTITVRGIKDGKVTYGIPGSVDTLEVDTCRLEKLVSNNSADYAVGVDSSADFSAQSADATPTLHPGSIAAYHSERYNSYVYVSILEMTATRAQVVYSVDFAGERFWVELGEIFPVLLPETIGLSYGAPVLWTNPDTSEREDAYIYNLFNNGTETYADISVTVFRDGVFTGERMMVPVSQIAATVDNLGGFEKDQWVCSAYPVRERPVDPVLGSNYEFASEFFAPFGMTCPTGSIPVSIYEITTSEIQIIWYLANPGGGAYARNAFVAPSELTRPLTPGR